MNGVVETAANNHLTSAERDRGVDILSRGVWYGVKLCEVVPLRRRLLRLLFWICRQALVAGSLPRLIVYVDLCSDAYQCQCQCDG